MNHAYRSRHDLAGAHAPPGISDWDEFRSFFFSQACSKASFHDMLAVTAQIVGSLIGLGLYFLRRSSFMPFRQLANSYIWIFRGTPLLVQVVLFWQLFPFLRFGNRSIMAFNFKANFGLTNEYFVSGMLGALLALASTKGPTWRRLSAQALIDRRWSARGGKSLGYDLLQGMRRIVIPQALRIIVPPLGNEFNSMLKSSRWPPRPPSWSCIR